MEANFENMMKTITDHMQNIASTQTVMGEQFTLGEFTCVPVIRVGMGFGSGGGSGEDKNKAQGTGGGGGGGIGVEPVGFLVSRGDQISFVSVGKKGTLQDVMAKMPELIDHLAVLKTKKGKSDTENDNGAAEE